MKTVYFVPDLGYMASLIGINNLNYITAIVFDQDGYLVTVYNNVPIAEKMSSTYNVVTRE